MKKSQSEVFFKKPEPEVLFPFPDELNLNKNPWIKKQQPDELLVSEKRDFEPFF